MKTNNILKFEKIERKNMTCSRLIVPIIALVALCSVVVPAEAFYCGAEYVDPCPCCPCTTPPCGRDWYLPTAGGCTQCGCSGWSPAALYDLQLTLNKNPFREEPPSDEDQVSDFLVQWRDLVNTINSAVEDLNTDFEQSVLQLDTPLQGNWYVWDPHAGGSGEYVQFQEPARELNPLAFTADEWRWVDDNQDGGKQGKLTRAMELLTFIKMQFARLSAYANNQIEKTPYLKRVFRDVAFANPDDFDTSFTRNQVQALTRIIDPLFVDIFVRSNGDVERELPANALLANALEELLLISRNWQRLLNSYRTGDSPKYLTGETERKVLHKGDINPYTNCPVKKRTVIDIPTFIEDAPTLRMPRRPSCLPPIRKDAYVICAFGSPSGTWSNDRYARSFTALWPAPTLCSVYPEAERQAFPDTPLQPWLPRRLRNGFLFYDKPIFGTQGDIVGPLTGCDWNINTDKGTNNGGIANPRWCALPNNPLPPTVNGFGVQPSLKRKILRVQNQLDSSGWTAPFESTQCFNCCCNHLCLTTALPISVGIFIGLWMLPGHLYPCCDKPYGPNYPCANVPFVSECCRRVAFCNAIPANWKPTLPQRTQDLEDRGHAYRLWVYLAIGAAIIVVILAIALVFFATVKETDDTPEHAAMLDAFHGGSISAHPHSSNASPHPAEGDLESKEFLSGVPTNTMMSGAMDPNRFTSYSMMGGVPMGSQAISLPPASRDPSMMMMHPYRQSLS